MEPVAVNHIVVDRALFAEACAATFSKHRQRMLRSCGIVFLAFGLILLFVQTRLPVASALSFPALLSGALVLVWALTLQKTELRRKYKAFRRSYGDASERTIVCERSGLSVDTGRGKPVEIDYVDICEVRQTEHMILLICRDHSGLMLSKDGFQSGSWPQVNAAIEKARADMEAMKQLGL